MKAPDHIHAELLNWSRWCWLGEWPHPLPSNHCGSLESQYRAPPLWDMDLAEAPPAPYIRPNDKNAQRVQEVYESLETADKLVLKTAYPSRRDFDSKTEAAHHIGLGTSEYDSRLEIIIRKVGAVFEVRA